MKKTVLSLVFACFCVGIFAQSGPKEMVIAKKDLYKSEPTTVNPNYVAPPRVPMPLGYRGGGTTVQLGTSYNVYSILREGQNQVSYNSDINALTFAHRQNNGAAGGSGIISFDHSLDNGLTWNSATKALTPSVGNGLLTGNRYPDGAIWNPAGNTNVANARVVVAGGALISTTGTWGMAYQASSKLDGTDIKEHYYATPDTNSLIPDGLTVLPNGDMFIVDHWANGHSVHLTKYTYNSTTSDFDMTHQYLPYDTVGVSAIQTVGAWNMAFGPNGTTGYIVLNGTTLEHGTAEDRPMIWKTMDGGTTWNRLPGIDYSAFPDIIATTTPTDVDPTVFRPWIRNFDLTVDMNGDLNIFVNLGSYFDVNFEFIYVGGSNSNDLWLLKTSDGTSYNAEYIHPWNNYTWGDVNGGTDRWFGPRPQASRSADGSKLFFTFTETDTLFTSSTQNQAPDVWAYARNLTNGFDTLKNLSTGTNAEFSATWATIAPIVIEGKNGVDFEIPIVYGVPSGGELDPIQYYYLQGVGFDLTELLYISTNELAVEEANISVFPNPTTGKVSIDLTALTEDVNIEVFNIVGQQMKTITNARQLTTLDLSNLSNGVYFVKISNDEATISKKVVISHQ